MAFQVLDTAKIYIDGYDVSGSSNQVALKYGADSLDDTCFGATAKSRLMGVKRAEFEVGGFYEAGDGKIDTIMDSLKNVAGKVITICPTDGAAGEIAFSVKGMLHEYETGSSVGEILPFKLSGSGTGELVRGTVLENAAKTATGMGTARELGAVGASQKLYASLHVLAVSGTNPTLDLVLQTDAAEAFTTPTDKIIFSQMTTVGAQWGTPVSGELTDTWYRASYTIGGTDTPSFSIVLIVSIQ